MISFSGVYKRYLSGFEALKNINFTIEPAEMVFITGHSGAGKSTLLKLIAAIERPTTGSIVINGQNLAALNSNEISFLRRNLGLVFQDQKFYLTVPFLITCYCRCKLMVLILKQQPKEYMPRLIR